MPSRSHGFLVTGLCVLALALGACSDSDNSPEPVADTTPPLVVGTTPADGQIGVSTNAAITVTFNEAMAPASATGQVTLSSGGAPTITWLSDRQFRLTHPTTWSEGVEVHVTVATGLTDAAGNALAAPYTFSFFTETSTLLLLNTEPADGATGVTRNASVRLQFSLPVDESSLAANTTISDGTNRAFTVIGADNNWYTLDLTDTLPASTLFTVTVGAAVHVFGSPLATLGTPATFQFTTGADVDTTPPTIVSYSPADGTTNVPADAGMLAITFSEPIDPASFEPLTWNIEFALLILGNHIDPVWSQDNTVLTVALPTLPSGLEMALRLGQFRDSSGNLQTNEYDWYARVAGPADVWPMADSLRTEWYVEWSRGPAGSSTPSDSGWDSDYRQIEVQGNGDIRDVSYPDGTYTTASRWEAYDRSSSAIDWLGFSDSGDGGDPNEIVFDSPLRFLSLPPTVGTWADDATVTVPGQGTYTASFSGRVIGREDLPLPVLKTASATSYYYKGAWKVARSLQVHLDGVWFTTQNDTVWYSPTLGPVHEITHEDSPARDGDPAGWYRTSGWLVLGRERLLN